MELPGPPLSIGTLSEQEVEVLRQLLSAAKEKGYLEQQDFSGGDIRNFLAATAITRGKRYREYQRFIESLYKYAMKTLPAQISETDSTTEVGKRLTELFDLGVKSGRYDRDITYYMNSFIEGDMVDYNVQKNAFGSFIGYRYSTDKQRILRFLVHIFLDKTINRTRFWSYVYLTDSDRVTLGFAYYAPRTGNTYLSGFIDQGLGCEFIAHKALLDSRIHSGVITTTDSKGFPTAKQCVLIDPKHIILNEKQMISDELLATIDRHTVNKESHAIFQKIVPINDINQAETVRLKRRTYRINELLNKDLMTEIPHDKTLLREDHK